MFFKQKTAYEWRISDWSSDVCSSDLELYDHRNVANFLHPLGDHARIFRHLTHRGAHSTFAHSVRAAEIKLEPIAASVLRTLDNLVPSLAFRLNHQRARKSGV